MIRPEDSQLQIELLNDVAELGGRFEGHIRRSPVDGAANPQGMGQVRAVRLTLRMFTDGRGSTDSEEYGEIEAAVDEYGMTSTPFLLPVPVDAPISYDGSLIRIRWQLVVRTDRKMALDSKMETEVLVVPQGGANLYRRPHPL